MADLTKPQLLYKSAEINIEDIASYLVHKPERGLVLPKEDLVPQGWDMRSRRTAFLYTDDSQDDNLYHSAINEVTDLAECRLQSLVLQGTDREQINFANAYWDKVNSLHWTPQGKKAEALLCEFLNEKQRDTLRKKGYFLENHFKMKLVSDDYGHLTWQPVGPVWRFWIYVWPYFKVYTWLRRIIRPISFCWHPEEPLPPADIALTYLLQIRESPEQLLKLANW